MSIPEISLTLTVQKCLICTLKNSLSLQEIIPPPTTPYFTLTWNVHVCMLSCEIHQMGWWTVLKPHIPTIEPQADDIHFPSATSYLSKKAWVTVWLSYCSLPGIKCSYNSTEFRFKEVSSVSTCNSCYVPSIVFFFFSKVIILGGNKCWWIELNWKALDTFGNCQRPVFSWCIPTCIITNLWTFWLNCSSKLQEKKNIIVAQICVLSHYTHNKRLQAWSLLI